MERYFGFIQQQFEGNMKHGERVFLEHDEKSHLSSLAHNMRSIPVFFVYKKAVTLQCTEMIFTLFYVLVVVIIKNSKYSMSYFISMQQS